ncbi:MAG: type II toxin-antitoxin system RelE/ParE family toxin [Gammaproteobacteria bacterium]|nr:type II toxin-antitoxin system RelE/ParE family toxin [Gammaproteobacteria bacterium]
MVLRVFKTRWFHRWAKRAGLSDNALLAAINEMERGLIGDALGGFVFKKRVAFPGKGKRGGTRTVIVYRRSVVAYFIFGFKKNQRQNVSRKELLIMKDLAADLLKQSPGQEQHNIDSGALIEVSENG